MAAGATAVSLSSGTPLAIHDELDSTSAEARRLIAAGDAPAGWIMARAQTAGYGRRGRSWSQAEGDLAATLIHPLSGNLAAHPAAMGFALSLAVAEALEASGAPARSVRLKWPNDVLLGDGKVSGILLEQEAAGEGAILCAGVGVNLVTRPDLPDYPTACLCETVGTVPAPEAFLDRIDTALTAHLRTLEAQGFAPLREAWLARATGIGEAITVRLPRETLHGTFQGLAGDGTLLLRQGEVIRSIATGDVFFPAGCASNAR